MAQLQVCFRNSVCQKGQSVTQTPSDNIPDHTSQTRDTASEVRLIRSEDLFCGDPEILIRHGSEIYRLRVTRSGKLILTK